MEVSIPARPIFTSQEIPEFFGFGYAGSSQSAMEVGGDFYEVLPISDSSLLLVMADVMGKGVAASVFAGSLRTLVHALAIPGISPSRCLLELNDLMFEELSQADMFITVQVVLADLHHRKLEVANAGHCPLLVSTPRGRLRTLAPEGIPLGVDPESTFASESVALAPCSSVVLYTDGITEARNPAGDLFGQGRLERWLRRSVEVNRTAAQLKRSLLQEVFAFQGSPLPADDQTFLIFSDETPRPESASTRDALRWLMPWNYRRSSATRGEPVY